MWGNCPMELPFWSWSTSKEEIYRKENPPYLLYGVAGGMGVVLVLFILGVLVTHRHRPVVAKATSTRPIDPDLTGDTAFRE